MVENHEALLNTYYETNDNLGITSQKALGHFEIKFRANSTLQVLEMPF